MQMKAMGFDEVKRKLLHVPAYASQLRIKCSSTEPSTMQVYVIYIMTDLMAAEVRITL